MERIETISVEECAKRLNKDPAFIRNAVEQGVFPGSCVKKRKWETINRHTKKGF